SCIILNQISSVAALAVDSHNTVAQTAISRAIVDFEMKQNKFAQHLRVLKINEKSSETDLCKALFANDSSPSLLIDATIRTNIEHNEYYDSMKRIARELGLPTVAIGTTNNEQWQDLTEVEKEILVDVKSVTETILNVAEEVIAQYNLRRIAIYYDDSFASATDSKFVSKLNNLTKTLYLYHLQDDDCASTLNDTKQTNITDILVFGAIENLNKLLEMPIKTKISQYDHRSLIKDVSNSEKVEAYFYYDLTRFALQIVDELISKSLWPLKLMFPGCGQQLSIEQKKQRVAIKMGSEMNIEGFYGRYGRFVIENQIRHNYQEITLKMSKVELWRKPSLVYSKEAEWVSSFDSGNIIFTSPIFKGRDISKIDEHPRQHLTTVTMIQPPFVMKRYNSITRQHEYFGYCIELLDRMRLAIYNKTGINYWFDLYEVPDGKYGAKDPATGEWNGLIGELQKRKARVAIGPVFVMAERESVVDFTVPYYDLVGISLLMKKPISDSHLFKFLTVLDNSVWLRIGIFYFLSSTLIWLTNILSPYSAINNRERIRNECHRREFTWSESLWFCMTSLTPQGGGEAPRNPSGKITVAVWWFFGFTIIAAYTANLAAFLTVSRLDPPIENIDHLSEQFRVRYATVKDSLEEIYFRRRAHIEREFFKSWQRMAFDGVDMDQQLRAEYALWDYPIVNKYTKMLKQMEITGMPETFEEGMRRVLASYSAHSGFVLVGEATKVRWAKYTNCELIQSGNEFSRKPMALAVAENDTLKDVLSSAILQLLNERKLEAMKEQWWNENVEKKQCEDHRRSSDGISIKNIGGIFVVIFGGVGFALTSVFLEWVWGKMKRYFVSNKVRTFRGTTESVPLSKPPGVKESNGFFSNFKFN
ncbi:glutamate receptor ionotropic: kainate 2-like protein, partial [Dinothrombium tinctorium]